MTGLLPVFGQQLILVCAVNIDLTQMGDIAFDGDLSAFLTIDGDFGEVGEDDDKGGRLFKRHLILELAFDDGYRVEWVIAIDVTDI